MSTLPVGHGLGSPLTVRQLLGLDDSHVRPVPPECGSDSVRLHPEACRAFQSLREAASADGFDLRIASGFRSFDRQARIWNGKARGERQTLDARELPLDVGELTEEERVAAILVWSALPGCSRHHWGTDLDVVDQASVAEGEPVRLEVRDWSAGGPFSALDAWLDRRIARGEAWGFFRPFDGRSCAVAAEPWHLSFAPVAAACERAFDRGALREALHSAGIELLAAVDAALDDILDRYLRNPRIPIVAHAAGEDTP